MYKDGESTILQTADLDSKEKLDALCKDPESVILAPDHALDLDMRADVVFANRDNSLKFIVERFFSEGYQRVVLWANNGIGRDTQGAEDGVMRADDGMAVGTRLNKTVQPFYQRGVPESYQNTAHQHIHIAPVMQDGPEFDAMLLGVLEGIHDWQEYHSLEEHRKLTRENTVRDHLPGISICVAQADRNDTENQLAFTHYPAESCFLFPQYVMSGLIRTVLSNFTKKYLEIDMNDPETKKEHIERTKEFYQKLLNP